MGIHNQTTITFECDSGISNIIEYMVKNYALDVTPIASCEGDVNKEGTGSSDGYILVIVRDMLSFDNFLFDVFGKNCYCNLNIIYNPEPMCRTFRVGWNPNDTENYDFVAKTLLGKVIDESEDEVDDIPPTHIVQDLSGNSMSDLRRFLISNGVDGEIVIKDYDNSICVMYDDSYGNKRKLRVSKGDVIILLPFGFDVIPNEVIELKQPQKQEVVEKIPYHYQESNPGFKQSRINHELATVPTPTKSGDEQNIPTHYTISEVQSTTDIVKEGVCILPLTIDNSSSKPRVLRTNDQKAILTITDIDDANNDCIVDLFTVTGFGNKLKGVTRNLDDKEFRVETNIGMYQSSMILGVSIGDTIQIDIPDSKVSIIKGRSGDTIKPKPKYGTIKFQVMFINNTLPSAIKDFVANYCNESGDCIVSTKLNLVDIKFPNGQIFTAGIGDTLVYSENLEYRSRFSIVEVEGGK